MLPKLRAKLAQVFAAAEDPRAEADAMYRQQVELLDRLHTALGEVTDSRAQLERQGERLAESLPKLRQVARRALELGQEDVARLALQRRRAAALELRRIEEQTGLIAVEEHQLLLAEQRLLGRVGEFRTRQEIAAARYTAAEAQVRIGEALAGVSDQLTDLGRAMQETEERTDAMQARASAIEALSQAGALGPTGAGLADAEESAGEAEEIDAELDALREEVASH
jgi:phage shock protein A